MLSVTCKEKRFPFAIVGLIVFVNCRLAPEISKQRGFVCLYSMSCIPTKPSLVPAANRGNNKSIFLLAVFSIIGMSSAR